MWKQNQMGRCDLKVKTMNPKTAFLMGQTYNKILRGNKTELMTIQEMYEELRRCYECTKAQSCLGCPFNGAKLDILQYLKNEMQSD